MAEMLRVRDVLSYLRLKPEMRAAEFGCGAGFFSLQLAARLPQGTVHALDIQPYRLERLRSDARRAGLPQVKTRCRDVSQSGGSGLGKESLDAVVIPNCLFQSENQYGILSEAARVLKRGGQLLLVDWRRERPLGLAVRNADPAEWESAAERLRLFPVRRFHAGDYHLGMIFEKA